MKIAIAQLNYTIGAFQDNVNAIIGAMEKAGDKGADLVVFSELSVCGYPPLDMLEHRNFIDECQRSLNQVAGATKGIAAIVGAPIINDKPVGKNLFNSAIFIKDGKVEEVIHKTLLPTYDIFDEYRYFQPGDEFKIITFMGKRIGLTICEDLWYQQPLLTDFGKNKLYTVNPMDRLAELGCDLIINIAASPFAYNHDSIKSEILSFNARKYKIPLIYVNQVGAHTDLIFDGGSRVIDPTGEVREKLPVFREGLTVVDCEELCKPSLTGFEIKDDDRIVLIYQALVMGIRDYFVKLGFKSAVIGLSGGIDSAVTLVLATEALGAENVRVLLLPSQYSSDHSVNDARQLAENLGVRYDIIDIRDIYHRYMAELSGVFDGRPADIAEENIQARIRGTLLMAISNKFGDLLLNTSNKSEISVGYGTLYGDMNGGIAVLGDVYKTDVYRVAEYINSLKKIIPQNTIDKPPSAELRPGQKDSDSLPDYDALDAILFDYIELKKSKEEIIGYGLVEGLVSKVIGMVNMNEYKRFQTPPILRVSSKAFGFGRRMPLVAKYS
jgi:NAD+ synthase (glutamine-hydrolysing)